MTPRRLEPASDLRSRAVHAGGAMPLLVQSAIAVRPRAHPRFDASRDHSERRRRRCPDEDAPSSSRSAGRYVVDCRRTLGSHASPTARVTRAREDPAISIRVRQRCEGGPAPISGRVTANWLFRLEASARVKPLRLDDSAEAVQPALVGGQLGASWAPADARRAITGFAA